MAKVLPLAWELLLEPEEDLISSAGNWFNHILMILVSFLLYFEN